MQTKNPNDGGGCWKRDRRESAGDKATGRKNTRKETPRMAIPTTPAGRNKAGATSVEATDTSPSRKKNHERIPRVDIGGKSAGHERGASTGWDQQQGRGDPRHFKIEEEK